LFGIFTTKVPVFPDEKNFNLQLIFPKLTMQAAKNEITADGNLKHLLIYYDKWYYSNNGAAFDKPSTLEKLTIKVFLARINRTINYLPNIITLGNAFPFLNHSFWSTANIRQLNFSDSSCVHNLPKLVNKVKSITTSLDNNTRNEKKKKIESFVKKIDKAEFHINPIDFNIVCECLPNCAILEPAPKSSSPDGFQNKSSQIINTKLIAKEVLTFIPPQLTYYHTLVIVGFGHVELPNDGKNFIYILSETHINLYDSIYIPPSSTISYEQTEGKIKEEETDDLEIKDTELYLKGKKRKKLKTQKQLRRKKH